MPKTPSELARFASSAVDAMRRGDPIPEPACTWLASGLSGLLAGRPLRDAFALGSRPGKPVESLVPAALRNQGIRALLLVLDPTGEHPTAAAREAARLIASDDPGPDDAGDLLLELRQAGPLSARQIQRIAEEARAVEPPAGETINRLVCLLSSK